LIAFRNIQKSFAGRAILKGVSFEIGDGEVFFIVGASGVGKSVLIKHLIGLIQPDAGEIWLDGAEISRFNEDDMLPIRKKCAMVFQHSTLFDSMSCADNVALPLRKHFALSRAQAADRARSLLDKVHMLPFAELGRVLPFAERFPAELGDGMRKRVAIARALALEPRYILFDEPTTSLDPVSARRVDRLIRELSSALGVTCVVVSHDLSSIFTIADRIVMLYKGEVRLLGTPDDFRGTKDDVIQQFIQGRAEGPFET
jgi:phospholipid/cholesterol/gamma-HCH transport system ATP-binding protein